jgi:hypothetical protein
MNQAVWLWNLFMDHLAHSDADTMTSFEVPPLELWPTPDRYTGPLSDQPVPFIVHGGFIRRYPNPPCSNTLPAQPPVPQASLHGHVTVRSPRKRAGSVLEPGSRCRDGPSSVSAGSCSRRTAPPSPLIPEADLLRMASVSRVYSSASSSQPVVSSSSSASSIPSTSLAS